MKSVSKGSSGNTKSVPPSALAKVSLGSSKSALVNKLPSGPPGNTKASPLKIPSSSSLKNSTAFKKSHQMARVEAQKGKGKMEDDDPSGICIRDGPGSAVPEKPVDGKGVIPQILQGTGGGRKEGSVRIANANVYESIGRLSPLDEKKEKEDDCPGDLQEDLASKRQQSIVGKDQGFVGRKTTAGGQQLTTGTVKFDKKQQRRFIRALGSHRCQKSLMGALAVSVVAFSGSAVSLLYILHARRNEVYESTTISHQKDQNRARVMVEQSSTPPLDDGTPLVVFLTLASIIIFLAMVVITVMLGLSGDVSQEEIDGAKTAKAPVCCNCLYGKGDDCTCDEVMKAKEAYADDEKPDWAVYAQDQIAQLTGWKSVVGKNRGKKHGKIQEKKHGTDPDGNVKTDADIGKGKGVDQQFIDMGRG